MEEIDYRKMYLDAEDYSQDELDKNLLKLSGGAFAVSFAFIDKLIATNPTWVFLLMISWVLWSASILAVLLSYNYSIKANRTAFDGFEIEGTFDVGSDFDWFSRKIKICNMISTFSFMFGVIIMIIFVSINFKVR